MQSGFPKDLSFWMWRTAARARSTIEKIEESTRKNTCSHPFLLELVLCCTIHSMIKTGNGDVKKGVGGSEVDRRRFCRGAGAAA
jgi:hypothetical protein